MSLILVGLNHRTAPVEIREQMSVAERDWPQIVERILRIDGVEGAALLSTCNRVEAVVSAARDEVVEPLVDVLSARATLSRDELEEHLYILRHREVVSHLFRVAAGLDSMIVGEPQIGGQVKSTYRSAQSNRTLDPTLRKLFDQTLHVAKRVRSETGIGEQAVSVPYAAVELARKIFGDLSGLQVLLVGAGKISELTAEHLTGIGVERVFVANRSHDRAIELARVFDGDAVQFEEIGAYLRSCDIVIASTAAPHFVISREQVAEAMATRRRRDLFLIDLSVPRNLDPRIAEVEGAYLYNIDDLREVVGANLERRMSKASEAETIVERETDDFLRRLAVHDAVPTIVELQERLETIRQGELEKCLRRLGPITTEQRAAIDALTSSIINKILHYPIIRLRESASGEPEERESFRETLRKIFGLR